MNREPLRTEALVEVLTKGDFRGFEWAVIRARRNSDAYGSKPADAVLAVQKLKEHLGGHRAEAGLLTANEQRALVWAVERASRDADGYPNESAAAHSAIAKLNATASFERQARLAGHRDWAYQVEERKAEGRDVGVAALQLAQDTLGRKLGLTRTPVRQAWSQASPAKAA